MSIERNTTTILMQDESPFTTMFNDVLNGITNTAALGVYCYLASKPSGWHISKKELQRHFSCGRDHINTCFKFLQKLGVLNVFCIRGEKGMIKQWEWHLKRHIPAAQSTIRETNTVETQHGGKPIPINKELIEIKDINNIGDSVESSTATAEEIVEAYHEVLPECPRIKVVDGKLKCQLNRMRKNWPSYQKDGKKFSIESFKDYLNYIKVHYTWFITPYVTPSGIKKNSGLRNLTRETNITKIVNGEFSANS